MFPEILIPDNRKRKEENLDKLALFWTNNHRFTLSHYWAAKGVETQAAGVSGDSSSWSEWTLQGTQHTLHTQVQGQPSGGVSSIKKKVWFSKLAKNQKAF